MVLALSLVVLALATVLAAARLSTPVGAADPPEASPTSPASPSPDPEETADPEPPPSPQPSPTPEDVGRVGASTVGQPWGTTPGVLMFRGNPTRTWYGLGPVPHEPGILWRYPDRAMCSREGERLWCGTGWTGQPIVWERPDGVTEVIVGGYDGAVHFVDADTGQPTRPRFQTGRMVKGSETLDPDGYPLLYTGSRDSNLYVVALDRDAPTELWRLPAHPQRVWNNDWDGNPAIVDDLMFVGGEDSWFRVVKLNRGYGPDGRVTVAPEVVFEMPGWTDQLFRDVGDRNVSIESSVALFEDRVYFANSGGRVVGLDVSRVEEGEAPVVFDFWAGDDTDATIVIDEEGMLYVAVELERFLPRAQEVGQVVKLDPYTDDEPIVWSVHVPPRPPPGVARDDGGVWSTPALHAGHLYVTTHPGDLLVVDTATGEVVYEERIGYHEWSSPLVVDDTLVIGTCTGGDGLRAWSLRDPANPVALWRSPLATGACIESTPAIWKGRIYVGSRDGFLYGFG